MVHRAQVQRSQSFTHFPIPPRSVDPSPVRYESSSKEPTQQSLVPTEISTNVGDAGATSPSSTSDDARQVKRTNEESSLTESADHLEPIRLESAAQPADLPDEKSITTDVRAGSEETKSTTPPVDIPDPDPIFVTAPSVAPDPIILTTSSVAPISTPTMTPRSPNILGRSIPSVPAGAHTPRRAAFAAQQGRGLAVPAPGPPAHHPPRLLTPVQVLPGAARSRKAAPAAKEQAFQSYAGVRS